MLENPDVEINEADIRMEVYRASGAGGQHINKTSSAVRLIHEPTGMVSASQEERSQLQNRETALTRLKAMVAAKVEEEREAELARIAGRQAQVGWGSQIRSYVLQPYQMVKDLRYRVRDQQRRRGARRRHRRAHRGLLAAQAPHGRRHGVSQPHDPLENVTKAYSTEVIAVRDASFDIPKGEFVFLVGASGSGKSTLLRLMNRQERPENGAHLGGRA